MNKPPKAIVFDPDGGQINPCLGDTLIEGQVRYVPENPTYVNGKRDKTPREEAAYWAGREDAQVLSNLYFAGSNVKAPSLIGSEEVPPARLDLAEAGKNAATLRCIEECKSQVADARDAGCEAQAMGAMWCIKAIRALLT